MEKIKLHFDGSKKEREIVAITFLTVFTNIKELFPYVVFQGGNALRFCYGSMRYPKDLDFVSGRKLKFVPNRSVQFIQDKLHKVFGNKVTVKYYHNSILHSFSASVYPKRKDRKRIEVKLKISEGIPALTNIVLPAHSKFVPVTVLLRVKKEEEILADKIVAVVNRPAHSTMSFEPKDLWDIYWLMRIGVKVNKEMVLKKLKFHNIGLDTFKQAFTERVKNIDAKKSSAFFLNEMMKFIEDNKIAVFSEEDIKSTLSYIKKRLMNLDFS